MTNDKPHEEVAKLLDEYANGEWTIVSHGAAIAMRKAIEPLVKNWYKLLQKDAAFQQEFERGISQHYSLNSQKCYLYLNSIHKVATELEKRK